MKFFDNMMRKLDACGPELAAAGALLCLGAALYKAIKAAPEGATVAVEHAETVERIKSTAKDARNERRELAKARVETCGKYVYAYRWAMGFGVGSAALMVLSNRLSGRKIATLAATLALNEDKLQRIYDHIGITKKDGESYEHEMRVQDTEAMHRIEDEPELSSERSRKARTADEDRLEAFYEPYTGTLFESTKDDVIEAIGRAKSITERDKRGILNHNKWRALLGLEDVPSGCNVGWCLGRPFDVRFLTSMRDGREVTILSYRVDPFSGYLSGEMRRV